MYELFSCIWINSVNLRYSIPWSIWDFKCPVVFIVLLCGSLPVTVTTRIITLLVRDHRESLWTLISHCSWEGPLPIYIVYYAIYVSYWCSLKFNSKSSENMFFNPELENISSNPWDPSGANWLFVSTRIFIHLRPGRCLLGGSLSPIISFGT